MRFIPIGALVVVMTAAVGAQDRDQEVTTRTTVEADDATAVSLTGCLRQDVGGTFTLVGTMVAAGDDVTTKTKVETDVDDDDVEVKTTTRSRADDAVGTSGAVRTFGLMPRNNVTLAPHVGKQVRLSAVVLEPGEDDAEVEIKDKTTVDPDEGPERTSRSRTEVEVENVPHGRFAVVAVKPLGTSCTIP